MSKTFFVGNMESPFIKEVLNKLIFCGKEIIMSADSVQKLGKCDTLKGSIQTWSWNGVDADLHIQNDIMSVFPYLYPDTISYAKMESLFNNPPHFKKTYSNFRLGFGVQDELFDLFLTQLFGAAELAYFDVLTSLRLLNPVNQLEYRKRSYEFLRFSSKDIFLLSERNLAVRRYKIIRPIPFYNYFSEKFGYPTSVSYYVLEDEIV